MNKLSTMMVVCEAHQNELIPVSKQLLSKAHLLCESHSMRLISVLLNSNSIIAEETLLYGADEAYLINHEMLNHYTAQAYAYALVWVIEHQFPSIVLFGATDISRDLAATCAARLRTGLTAFCTSLEIDSKENKLLQTRPAYGGQVMATIMTMNSSLQMATVKPDVFEISRLDKIGDDASVTLLDIDFSEFKMLTKILSAAQRNNDNQLNLDKAVVIGCGGAVKDKETLALVNRLAQLLNASVGASRKVVESGLLPRALQIGLTGKTIRPKVYLALGLSGSVQHLEGMKESDCIIAVNTDLNAPIFDHADYGVIMDLHDFLVKIIELVENN